VKSSPVERLREIWTPDREVAELFADLDPQTELDSLIRHFFHAIIQRQGSVTLDLGSELHPQVNTGQIRWEIVHGPGPTPELRPRQVTIWHET